MELFVIVIFLSFTGAQESQLEGPVNTLSFAGSTVFLRCLPPSRNCNGIDWQKFMTGASPITIFKGPSTILNIVDKDRYIVHNSDGCHLVIENVQLTDAGRYICSANISSNKTSKSADLIILDALEGPENTLGFVGSTVALNCSTPFRNCSGIDWQKYVYGTSPMTIFKGPRTILNTNVTDRARYSVDNSSGCDLVIRNVQLTDAGRFFCSAIVASSQSTKTAHLILLETQPKCTLNVSLNDTVEGDEVQLKCAVSYNGTNEVGVSMIWKGVADAPDIVKNGNTISRIHSVVASASDVPSFTCEASFTYETHQEGTLLRGLATNSIPNTMCATSAIKVLYSVRNVTLMPSLSTYSPETVITCAAKGHPSPTFKWQEMENGSIWIDIRNGSEFTMTDVSSKRYRCVAMNIVRGQNYNATSNEILVNNAESGYAVSDSTATTITNIRLQYIMMTVTALFLLLIIFLIVCFYVRTFPGYKWRHSRSKSRDKIREEHPLGQNPVISSNVNQVGEKESAYTSLGADRDANEYMSIEQKPEAKAKKKKRDEHIEQPLRENRDNSIKVGEQESAYASLGADRDANEYASLEQRQKPKSEKRSKP